MRILLAEEDHRVGKAVRAGLERAGFALDWVLDGRSAARALAETDYGLAVVDLGLPALGGMELLCALRRSGDDTPVLILKACDAVGSSIAALNAGADDYMLKPFDLDELVARIRAILRRHAGGTAGHLVSGGLRLDPVKRSVTWNGAGVGVSAREFAILEALLLAGGAVLSRQQLETSIYNWGDEIASNAIEVHVHHLRKKLGSTVITNMRGMGYRLAAAQARP
jgi:two-component system response regulator QseB